MPNDSLTALSTMLDGIDLQNKLNTDKKLDSLLEALSKSDHAQQAIPTLRTSKILNNGIKVQDLLRNHSLLTKNVPETKSEYAVVKNLSPINSIDWSKPLSPNDVFIKTEKTIGPFISVEGLPYYFNFYRYIDAFNVMFPYDTKAAFIVPLRVNRLVLNATLSVLTLSKGTIWIRADLMDTTAPKDQYVGIKITGGTIQLNASYSYNNDMMTIPANANLSMEWALDNSWEAQWTSDIGIDARKAIWSPSNTISLRFSHLQLLIVRLGAMRGNVFGWETECIWKNTLFKWDAENKYIILDLAVQNTVFQVLYCDSTLYKLKGDAKVQIGQWVFPCRTLSQNTSMEINFNGLLKLKLDPTLKINWKGIDREDRDVLLPACQITFTNGLLIIQDKKVDYQGLQEHYTLWQKSQEKPYMDAPLQMRKGTVFQLIVQSEGNEGIGAYVDGDFVIDRPLKADNIPVHPQTQNSIYAKVLTNQGQSIMLMDSDLLSENPRHQAITGIKKRKYQFALENAFFTTTPESGLVLTANFDDRNHLFKGKLLLNYGVYNLLPTLPHPYTANTRLNTQDKQLRYLDRAVEEISKSMMQATVTWDTIDEFTASEVDFNLSQHFLDTNSGSGVYTRKPTEEEIRIANTQFTLFDVSTQADHWGISLSFSNLESLNRLKQNEIVITGENAVTIKRMHLEAPMALLHGLTLPHVSWEPAYNLAAPDMAGNKDPQHGLLEVEGNTQPTIFSQLDPRYIPILPITYIQQFRANLLSFANNVNNGYYLQSKVILTLPNGKISHASLYPYSSQTKIMDSQHLQVLQSNFKVQQQAYTGSIQLRIAAVKNDNLEGPPLLPGSTQQLMHLINESDVSILGESVSIIFNERFKQQPNENPSGVPITHIDFSGYGASTYSNWLSSLAKFASISQAKFDIVRGRTANELVQAVSVIYPWGISTCRTVTFPRKNNAIPYRDDSGWVAQSDGLFDFSFKWDNNGNTVSYQSPYSMYPGLVKGLYNVHNIKEDGLDVIELDYSPQTNDYYVNYTATTPSRKEVRTDGNGGLVHARFVAVYFDADAQIANVPNVVTGVRFKGYLQLQPEGVPVPNSILDEIIRRNQNNIGGSIDTTFLIEGTKQKFKANRIEMAASFENDNPSQTIFVASIKGSVVLPPDGSWSVVEVDNIAGDVSNIAVGTSVGLIKKGLRDRTGKPYENNNSVSFLAMPDALFNSVNTFPKAYAILQNTGTQKLLLRAPRYDKNAVKSFVSDTALLADCFRLLDSKGPFPNINSAIALESGISSVIDLLDDGIQKKIENLTLPDDFNFNIYGDENSAFRIYVKYDSNNGGNNKKRTVINYLTSTGPDSWKNDMHNLTIGVDLLCFKPIMYVTGSFGAGQKVSPSINVGDGPLLKLNPLLEKIYQILEFLNNLDPTQPSEAVAKGLKVAMSNSADSWEYKFKADKEIPLVKFPFDPINYNSPTTPLKLDAFFKMGLYFNQPIKIPNAIEQLKPSIGAYLALGADLRIMCFSLGAATIYAMGRAEVGLSADLNNPPTLHFKFGFGVELSVGLPVIGSVAVTYMVGIDMSINSQELIVAAFIYFRGRAEICGGIVTVTIAIEAAGKIHKIDNGPTNCVAMCTFALDISVMWVININFTETWE